MKSFTELISDEVRNAFEKAGYNRKYGMVTVSNRPDLCEYQCNGAMAAKKEYGTAPRTIAETVVSALADSPVVKDCEVAGPGFINFNVKGDFLAGYLNEMKGDARLGIQESTSPKTVIVDYGGANVAKPLHVGHLRAAIIGESVKRILRFGGDKVIGDVHLGDWGLQIGLIITRLAELKPDLPYFDEQYEGEYPEEAPFTISELETIYPEASAKSKEDPEFMAAAHEATRELQSGRRGYLALWHHIMDVSVADLKKNYDRLNVEFDLWKGESDVQKYIPDMVDKMIRDGYAYEDQGAIIVDVSEESDAKEVPPCIVRKTDGSALYTTTDLATLLEREQLYAPDKVIYVVDKRQAMHFVQVFRAAGKTGIVPEGVELFHLGFGTMNGKDGKPFKTREGGVMRLEDLIGGIEEKMLVKIAENKGHSGENDRETAKTVGLAAIKYGDLSNQASKDYVFDPERFTSFEGNTGPYILYTIVRIKSILAKYAEAGGKLSDLTILPAFSDSEKDLMMQAAGLIPAFESACTGYAPHRLCSYIYELSNSFNSFYHDNRILAETDTAKQKSWIALISLVKDILELMIDLLGFDAPEKM